MWNVRSYVYLSAGLIVNQHGQLYVAFNLPQQLRQAVKDVMISLKSNEYFDQNPALNIVNRRV